MQGTRSNRRKIIYSLLSGVILCALLVFIDQITKIQFKKALTEKNKIKLLGDFLYLTYTFNVGSAYSFMANVSWGQTFFKILTPIALVLFSLFLFYAEKKGYRFLSVSVIVVIAGTLGNFLDRIMYGGVIDFICIELFDTRLFGIFNLADVMLSFGVICIFIHYIFIDENALIKTKKENGTKDESN